jgi:hypothetical protein
MKPPRTQRNTLCPQEESIKGNDIRRRQIDSLVGNEAILKAVGVILLTETGEKVCLLMDIHVKRFRERMEGLVI